MDLKQALQHAAAKYTELNIHPKDSSLRQLHTPLHADRGRDSDSDGEEFEDVPEKEGYEPFIPDHLREEYGESTLHHPYNLVYHVITSEQMRHIWQFGLYN